MEPSKRETAVYLTLCIVAAGSVVLLGRLFGPSDAKIEARRMDARRIRDLTNISSKVNGYVNQHSRLPESLGEASINIHDPGSAKPYVYHPKDSRSYELCASFDRSTGASPQFAAGHFWDHSSGLQCTTISALKR